MISASFKRPVFAVSGQGVGYFEISIKKQASLIYAYCQSYKWPKTVKNDLKRLAPIDGVEIIAQYSEYSKKDRPLIVHVRLGDYRNEQNFGIPPREYYEQAISKLWGTGNYKRIWLFSDEFESAIEFLDPQYRPYVRVIPNLSDSASITLEIMKLGFGYVIGNSTFGWWGAFLCKQENPSVIVPDPWFKNLNDPIDLVPPEWIRLKLSQE